jgi:hypothetical protein
MSYRNLNRFAPTLSPLSDASLQAMVGGGGEITGTILTSPGAPPIGTVTGSVTRGPWTTLGSFSTDGHGWSTRLETNRISDDGWRVGAWVETNSARQASTGILIGKKW